MTPQAPEAGHLVGEGAQVMLYELGSQLLALADDMSRLATTDAQSRVWTSFYLAVEPMINGLGILANSI